MSDEPLQAEPDPKLKERLDALSKELEKRQEQHFMETLGANVHASPWVEHGQVFVVDPKVMRDLTAPGMLANTFTTAAIACSRMPKWMFLPPGLAA